MSTSLDDRAAATFCADLGVIGGQLRADVRIDVDRDGVIVGVGWSGQPLDAPPSSTPRSFGPALIVPGMVNAHSHAFQRGIRGLTQRRTDTDPSSFWSWRDGMYRAANGLDPDGVYTIARIAFAEMLASGITCVGEFHYLHQQPDGEPYDDANELGWQIVRAAQDVGIRLTLLDVYYAQAGPDRPALPEQRRFCDDSTDAYLRRLDALREAGVDVGVTPHSVRAVPAAALAELCDYGNQHQLVVHTHLSEQPRENEECAEVYGTTPARVFADAGAMSRSRAFTAVHAVHITDDDRGLLGEHSVCACPSTEADLGDGIVGAAALQAAGTNLCLGSDSNAIIDLVQEARLLEMGERLASGQRLRLTGPSSDLGLSLLCAATTGGAVSLGRQHEIGSLDVGRRMDAAVFDLRHPLFYEVPPTHALDALLTAGTSAPLRQVIVNGVERL